MAKALASLKSPSSSTTPARSLQALCTLRLVSGYTILLGACISLLGVSWDIQWHAYVGRDRTLIPPHVMSLSGLTISGLAALAAVLIETAWVRRNPLLATYSTSFAGLFSSSLGAYIAGFAALNAAVGFPLDSYWHALYGIDVGIWAPFHVMILAGGALIPLGAAYMLVSAAQLGSSAENRRSVRAGYIGALLAFAAMLSVFTILLSDALNNRGFMTLDSITINLFPLLSGLLVAWTCVTVVYAIPWRRVATSVVLFYLFFALLFAAFVPPATNYLLTLEHLSYRRDLGIFALLSLVATRFWSLTPILVALLIDHFFWRAQQKGWSLRKLTVTMAVASLIGCLPVVALIPLYPLRLFFHLGLLGSLISLLLGLLGTCVGTWFGLRLGLAMQQDEGR